MLSFYVDVKVKKIKVSIKSLKVRLDSISKESFEIQRGLLYAIRFSNLNIKLKNNTNKQLWCCT